MRKPPVKTWSTPVAEETSRLVPCVLCGGNSFATALMCEGFSYVRCKRCGLVQMNPQPTPEDVALRYKEAFGGDYLNYELANEAAFLELQRLALKDAGFEQLEKELFFRGDNTHNGTPPRVLDVGCATGALLLQLRQRGWETTGVEISPSAEYARSKRGIDVRSLPLEKNRFPENCFDLLLASHLIEHLNDPRSFAAEAWRITKHGGRVFITTPNIAGFQARIFGNRWRSAIFDHIYLFSLKTIKALLAKAGFTIEGAFTWGGLAAGTVPQGLKKIADRMVKPLGMGDVMLVRAVKPF